MADSDSPQPERPDFDFDLDFDLGDLDIDEPAAPAGDAKPKEGAKAEAEPKDALSRDLDALLGGSTKRPNVRVEEDEETEDKDEPTPPAPPSDEEEGDDEPAEEPEVEEDERPSPIPEVELDETEVVAEDDGGEQADDDELPVAEEEPDTGDELDEPIEHDIPEDPPSPAVDTLSFAPRAIDEDITAPAEEPAVEDLSEPESEAELVDLEDVGLDEAADVEAVVDEPEDELEPALEDPGSDEIEAVEIESEFDDPPPGDLEAEDEVPELEPPLDDELEQTEEAAPEPEPASPAEETPPAPAAADDDEFDVVFEDDDFEVELPPVEEPLVSPTSPPSETTAYVAESPLEEPPADPQTEEERRDALEQEILDDLEADFDPEPVLPPPPTAEVGDLEEQEEPDAVGSLEDEPEAVDVPDELDELDELDEASDLGEDSPIETNPADEDEIESLPARLLPSSNVTLDDLEEDIGDTSGDIAPLELKEHSFDEVEIDDEQESAEAEPAAEAETPPDDEVGAPPEGQDEGEVEEDAGELDGATDGADGDDAPAKKTKLLKFPALKPLELAGVAVVLIACGVALVMFTGTVSTVLKAARASEEKVEESVPGKIKGEHIELSGVEAYWRDRAPLDRVDENSTILPVIEVASGGGSGMLQILLFDEQGNSRGDSHTYTIKGGQFEPGGSSILALGTEGLNNEVQFAAYRDMNDGDNEDRWTVLVRESADGSQWNDIVKFLIPPDRRPLE